MESIELKACVACGVEKPRTLEFFAARRDRATPFRGTCKQCENAKQFARRVRKPTPERELLRREGLKRCPGCSEIKPLDTVHFAPRYRPSGSVHPRCRVCLRQASRERHKQNPEKAIESSKRYRKANWEKVKASHYRWRAEHPEAWKAIQHKRVARRLEVGGTWTAQDVEKKLQEQKGACYWCRVPFAPDVSYHVDHIIPLARGGSNGPGNICCACASCNHRKHAKMPHEFAGRLF